MRVALATVARWIAAVTLLALFALKASVPEVTLADPKAIVTALCEAAIGSALLLNAFPRWAAPAACVLGIVLAVVSLASPPKFLGVPCSCFGPLHVAYAWRLVVAGLITSMACLHLLLLPRTRSSGNGVAHVATSVPPSS